MIQTKNGSLKLYVFILTIFVSTGITFLIIFFLMIRLNGLPATKIVLKSPLTEAQYKGIGYSGLPLLTIPVKTNSGYVERDFLIDSGSTISSMPAEMAPVMGKTISSLPRRVFKGFGNTTSFAYETEMTLVVGDKELTVPVVFTEDKSSEFLIGRKVFFDEFSVYFNHIEHTIELRS